MRYLILILFAINLQAQECYIEPMQEGEGLRSEVYVPETLNVGVHFINHCTIINGVEFFSITGNDVYDMIDSMNAAYETINFYFKSMATTFDPSFWDFEYTTDKDAMTEWELEGFVMNIHIVGTVSVNGAPYGGVARYPYNGKMWCVVGRNYKNLSTLEHEAGHTMGLYHTHENSHLDFLAEFVNGFECDVRGDLVCDTKADSPYMRWSGCTTPIRTVLDFNGEVIEGEPLNVMSYNAKHCRTEITEGQEYRARMILAKYFGDGIPTGVKINNIDNKEFIKIGEVEGINLLKKVN